MTNKTSKNATKTQFNPNRKYRKGDVYYTGKTRWVYVGELAYDVHDKDGNVTLPAGTKGVAIAYRSASWVHRKNGKLQAGNLYRCRGKVY